MEASVIKEGDIVVLRDSGVTWEFKIKDGETYCNKFGAFHHVNIIG